MRARLAFPVLALLLAGCGTNIDYIPLNTPPHAMTPRSPDSVELFTTSLPSRPFVEVGTIEAQQQGASRDKVGDIYAKMRLDAAQRGCDGLVIIGTNNLTVVSGSSSGVSSTTLKGFRATCIAYSGGVGAPPPPPPPPAAPAPGAAHGTGPTPKSAAPPPAAAPAAAVAPYVPPPAAEAGLGDGVDRAGFALSAGIGFVVGSNSFNGFAASFRGGYTFPMHLYFGGDVTFYPTNGTTLISIAPELGYDVAVSGVPLVIRPYAGLGLADSTAAGQVAFELYPGVEALYHVTREFFVGGDARIPLVFYSGGATGSIVEGGITIPIMGTGSETFVGFNLMATAGYKF